MTNWTSAMFLLSSSLSPLSLAVPRHPRQPTLTAVSDGSQLPLTVLYRRRSRRRNSGASAPPQPTSPLVTTMPSSPTIPPEALAASADLAWQYRERPLQLRHRSHREIINLKAKLRMRRKREEIRHASSAVKLEHRIRERHYRRRYRARRKLALTPAGRRQLLLSLTGGSENEGDSDSGTTTSRRGRPGHNEEDIELAASRVKFCPCPRFPPSLLPMTFHLAVIIAALYIRRHLLWSLLLHDTRFAMAMLLDTLRSFE
ncbi:hypothetical protein R3P38DRAFT_3190891 [Favolaschia claudopus]|uniref:Uncharacterized protein n=1 Tax=Favolaschia claudopus TaxID=2862362 RepID=A0AAW0BMS6_9AGAR